MESKRVFERPQATYRTHATRTVASACLVVKWCTSNIPYMIHLFEACNELVCKHEVYRCCYCSQCDRASNAKISSEISVDLEEIVAHIDAAANTFGAYLLRTRKKKNDNIDVWVS